MQPAIGTISARGERAVRSGVRRPIALAVVVAVIMGVVALAGASRPADAAAAAASPVVQQFDPGYLVDDADFYTSTAMTEQQIQEFLETHEPGKCGNPQCLKQLTVSTVNGSVAPAKDGASLCAPYVGAADESAALVIYKVEQACGISAKVILVILQKEQSLVTSLAPTVAALQRAMGYACPDSGTCAATTLGFQNQIYVAASQLKRYRHSTTFPQPGLLSVRYSPKAGCGRKTFIVANYATAALYDYTPYLPDAAALNSLALAGDTCSSYGNRNFALFYRSWFGGPSGDPQGDVMHSAKSDTSVTLSGWAVDPNMPGATVTVRVSGNGWSEEMPADHVGFASLGSFAGAGPNHAFSTTVLVPGGSETICVDALNLGSGYDASLGCTTVRVPGTPAVSALATFAPATRRLRL